MKTMRQSFTSLVKREDGQTMAEYGIILLVIAVVVAVLAVTLGTQISGAFQNVIDAL